MKKLMCFLGNLLGTTGNKTSEQKTEEVSKEIKDKKDPVDDSDCIPTPIFDEIGGRHRVYGTRRTA